jgi:hypothetical protein
MHCAQGQIRPRVVVEETPKALDIAKCRTVPSGDLPFAEACGNIYRVAEDVQQLGIRKYPLPNLDGEGVAGVLPAPREIDIPQIRVAVAT